MSRPRWLSLSCTLGVLGAASLVVGCNQPAATGCPAEMIDGCRVTQQACVASDGVAAHCEACPPGQYAAATGACTAIAGMAYTRDFAELTVDAGEEISSLCQSWTLNNPTELWVNAVELEQDASSHHSNWMFCPDNLFPGPEGIWRCKDRNYTQLDCALAGGALYAQSTQARKEVQKFPDGAVVRIPPWSQIIGGSHLLNASNESITGHYRFSIYALPPSEVKIKLTPFHLDYHGLDIPARATSRFTGQCDLFGQFTAAGGNGVDLSLYYLLPHYHVLGSRMFVEVMGGPHDGESLLDVRGFSDEARGKAFDPPAPFEGADGIRFGCEYVNPRDDSVRYGIGDQEMCEALGFADSRLLFDSTIAVANPDGQEGAIQRFTGPCQSLVDSPHFDRPGGPPR